VRHALKRYVAELAGTFVLVMIGPGAAMVSASTHAFGQLGISLAFGLAVAGVVASTGGLSGAHINPAVTLGLWSVRRFPSRDVIPYVVAQCVGAVAASALLVRLLGGVGNFGATVPSVTIARAFAIEAGYTAILGVVILAVSTDVRVAPTIPPWAIGATIFVGAFVTGPLTGGSFNPARTLGPAVVGHVWSAHWLYWAAPICGMIAAMHAYEAVRAVRERSLAWRS
jgi:aquaporin Z